MRVYLTNLGKYNEGILRAKWVDLPCCNAELLNHLTDIGINEDYEEYFITDYECELEHIKIGEYESLSKLNNLAIEIEEAKDDNKNNIELFNAYTELNLVTVDDVIKDGIVNVLENTTILEAKDDEELGTNYITELGGIEALPRETLEMYFNYEAYGRDLSFTLTKSGYAVSN